MIVVRKSKECFLVKLVKRYSNVSDLVIFLATVSVRTSFLLEIVQPFFYGRSEGPRAVACTGAALPCK